MNQTALVTGASSGIGYELAKLFAQDGCRLVLVARNEQALIDLAEELQAKHGISTKILAKDLSKSGAASEIFAELQRESIHVDILVNNAGLGTHGFFSETDPDWLLEVMQVNMAAITHLTRLFLTGMLQRKSGKIFNIASTAGFQPGPLMAVYYATKAYVLSLSEALANELRGTGVTVSVLCPGPTRTGFQARADMEDSGLISGKILKVMDAATVARIGYRGMMKNKTIVIPGLLNKIGVFSVRLGPRKLVAQIVRSLQEKRRK